MPAARDIDWTHIRVVGDKEAAAKHVPFARKLLGYVKQDARFNKLGVHQARKELADGTVVVAEMHGSIPRITIVPSEGGTQTTQFLEGFVLASSYSNVKPVVLTAKKSGGWHVHRAYPETFPRVQHLTNGSLSTSMDAPFLRGAGVFHENDDGEVVSWYFSGGCRHFYQEMTEPSLMFDRYVTHRGKVLFHSEQYAEVVGAGVGKPHILGAAIKDGWLYLVSANMNYTVDYTVPAAAAFVGDTFIAPQWVNGSQEILIWRVALIVVSNPLTGALEYRASREHETLFSGALHNAHGPWCFARDLSHVVTHAHPDEARYTWRVVTGPPAVYPVDVITPSLSHKRHFITLPSGTVTTTDETETIAEDSGKLLKLKRVSDVLWEYDYEGTRYPAYNKTLEQNWEIDYADLVNGWFVFAGRDNEQNDKYYARVVGPHVDDKHLLETYSVDPAPVWPLGHTGRLRFLDIDGLAMMSLRAHGPTTQGSEDIELYAENPDLPDTSGFFSNSSIQTAGARTGDYPNVSYGGATWDIHPSPHNARYLSFDFYGYRAAPFANTPGTLREVLAMHNTGRRMVKRDMAIASTKDDLVAFYNTGGAKIITSRGRLDDLASTAFPQNHAFSIYPLGVLPRRQKQSTTTTNTGARQ